MKALQVLVLQGWRHRIAPKMGQQLLILLGLLAGVSPLKTRKEEPSDDLKVAAFNCIAAVVKWLGQSSGGNAIFNEVGAKTVVDQSVYMLLEAITEAHSDHVQIAAAKALGQLQVQISDRVVLASLLPRTVSALTKALKPAFGARRTFRVLQTNLDLLTNTLRAVLEDGAAVSVGENVAIDKVASEGSHQQTTITLDTSWLKATASQVKLALANVVKLRNHERPEVRQALKNLCVMVLEECTKSLSESLSLMVETLTVLANDSDTVEAYSALKFLATTHAEIVDLLSTSLHGWIGTLPRFMQTNDERPKQRVLKQIATTFQLLSEVDQASMLLDDSLASSLVESVVAAEQSSSSKRSTAITESPLALSQVVSVQGFETESKMAPILLAHQSQIDSSREIQGLMGKLRMIGGCEVVIRSMINHIANAPPISKMAAIWLALVYLQTEDQSHLSIDDLIVVPEVLGQLDDTRAYLTSDLYSTALPHLLQVSTSVDDWRLTALAMQSLVLQAKQLATDYRPELIDTLYPVLSLLASPNSDLRSHAVKTLNQLAIACQYSSTADMLVSNVDYLVNSIALKLNTFDLSPQAPQVLLMMIRLCGARLLPYLDDLIGSIFAALDAFHGYPQLVEVLFSVLSAVVDESVRTPMLSITARKEIPVHKKGTFKPSSFDDILGDIHAHKLRESQLVVDGPDNDHKAPHRPWTTESDGSPNPTKSDGALDENNVGENDNETDPPPSALRDEKEVQLSKPHQLLLSIAQSTAPHLSSPSPHVRLTLLQLLSNIAQLLAHDENSFLPLVNTVWPTIVPRLLGDSANDTEMEPSFVVCAAAEAVSALCSGAGDFMAGRIEDIFPQLERLYRQVWRRVLANRSRNAFKTAQLPPGTAAISGTVDLRIVKTAPESQTIAPHPQPSAGGSMQDYTIDSQIHNALIGLFVAVIGHVRVTEDIGDSILEMLAPIMNDPGRENVYEALESWNEDAVWIWRQEQETV